MNATIQMLFNRKSVRVFDDKEIPDSDKALIIDAAIQGPTAGNQVLYTILDIEDQAVRDELALLCDNQPFIAKAKWVLVFLADTRRWLDCYRYAGAEHRKPGLGDILLACEDTLIAAQSAVVAAESMGIGSCYIGDILENKERMEELLGLDKYVLPITMLVFGYPTQQQKKRQKPKRFNRKYIVRKNRYSRLTEEELRAMFKEFHGEKEVDVDDYIRAFCKRKYMAPFSLEMTRSVEKYLEAFRWRATGRRTTDTDPEE